MAFFLSMRTHTLALLRVPASIAWTSAFWHADIAFACTKVVVEPLVSFAFEDLWTFACTFIAIPSKK
jgi:hypothetical protein